LSGFAVCFGVPLLVRGLTGSALVVRGLIVPAPAAIVSTVPGLAGRGFVARARVVRSFVLPGFVVRGLTVRFAATFRAGLAAGTLTAAGIELASRRPSATSIRKSCALKATPLAATLGTVYWPPLSSIRLFTLSAR
jgi:hypothetical protein